MSAPDIYTRIEEEKTRARNQYIEAHRMEQLLKSKMVQIQENSISEERQTFQTQIQNQNSKECGSLHDYRLGHQSSTVSFEQLDNEGII